MPNPLDIDEGDAVPSPPPRPGDELLVACGPLVLLAMAMFPFWFVSVITWGTVERRRKPTREGYRVVSYATEKPAHLYPRSAINGTRGD